MTDGAPPSLAPFVSQTTDEWATPPEFVRPLADAIDGFDLDPAAGAEHSPIAADTYTLEDDGLSRPWYGDVWLNPPYSEVAKWLQKATDEYRNGDADRILALVKGDTSTDWYQDHGFTADAIAFVDGRLSFGDGADAAPFASHVLVYGDVPPAVIDVLGGRGTVLSVTALRRADPTTLDDYGGGDRP